LIDEASGIPDVVFEVGLGALSTTGAKVVMAGNPTRTSGSCQGGYNQIRKVLSHARREAEQNKVNAVVYVGDCMEEDIHELSQRAGALGLLGVPMFLFPEGREPKAELAYRPIDPWCSLAL
jgi:hypothetical protein